ncbi:solute carrier family 23 protein [Saxibacter everestensis]|uniref:Solute carrier family 23 protein n=1 Tax=Saxibacter everestensis TaxID=2909229 RepID=A0ABY8QTS1_9MICO|nr:solute carrier family 23 protein [Brevibacteriaceae bacterium ZFBP1038]
MPIWKLHGDGKTIRPGDVVAPNERLSWGRTVGLGAQHVVSMFGATFVFPIIMGLNPQLAVMLSGFCTIIFLLIVKGRVPSYLGTSAAFVGGVAAIRAQGGTSAEVTGAILISGLVLAVIGLIIHFMGGRVVYKVLPPVVTGAVVMLIGFNLAPVVANTYWPQDQWVALIVMAALILMSIGLRGFLGRIAIFLSLVFGYVLSWILDLTTGQITAFDAAAGEVTTHFRVNWDGVMSASWFGLPPFTDEANGVVGIHAPSFSLAMVVLVLPGVIALVAENAGHVKAVSEMTGADLDPMMGRAIAADGVATALASSVGGSPTTTYAENIGVMAATKVYSTAAYAAAAVVAILFGFSPKFGALISATPGGVLGGITVVLYGMIGLLGAKIWRENKVDFGNPLNLVPVAAGLIIAIGDTSLQFSDQFSLSGISLGTIVVIVMYHLSRAIAPKHLQPEAVGVTLTEKGIYKVDDGDTRPGVEPETDERSR